MNRFTSLILLLPCIALAESTKIDLPTNAISRLDDAPVGEVHALCFADDRTLVIAGSKGWMRWNVHQHTRPLSLASSVPVDSLTKHDKRMWLGGSKALHVSEVPFATIKQSWETASERVAVLAVSRDGSRLVHTQGDLTLSLMDVRSGKHQGVIEFASRPIAASFCGNGRIMGVVTRDGAARVYYLSPKASLEPMWSKRIPRADRGAASFSPDGRLFAVASAGRVMVLESMTGRQLTIIERKFGEGDVRSLAFSPDGLQLAIGVQESTGDKDITQVVLRSVLRVCASETGQLLATFEGKQGHIEALAYSPDGKLLASAGSGRGILVWTTPASPKAMEPLAFSEAWNELDSLDAATAHRAQASLLANGAKSLEVIRQGLLGIAAEQQQIRQWVAQLDHDQFRTRESARRSLIKCGLRAAAVLTDAKRPSLEAEGEQRVRLILEELEGKGVRAPESGLFGEPLRIVRAVRVLEMLGGTDSRAILMEIVQETKDARLVKEATNALDLWRE